MQKKRAQTKELQDFYWCCLCDLVVKWTSGDVSIQFTQHTDWISATWRIWGCWTGLLLCFSSKLNVPRGPARPVNKYFLQLRSTKETFPMETQQHCYLLKRIKHMELRTETFSDHIDTYIAHFLFCLSYIALSFPPCSLPPPASSITGGQSDLRRTGAGETKTGALGLLQLWPDALQPRHRVRSDSLSRERAVNTAAWQLLKRATIQVSKLNLGYLKDYIYQLSERLLAFVFYGCRFMTTVVKWGFWVSSEWFHSSAAVS